nr:putative serine/threonine protein kinase [uncultured bacterium]
MGGYTVLRKLGAGGYGTVFLARERDGGLFALKFLTLEGAGRWGEREVSILLRLQHLAHPNVVKLLSHTLWPVTAPEYLVIVMEYVRGRSLDKWARDVNPTARAVACAVLDVARALAAVHAEGVVHRDVKPSNVLMREEDGRAVLADFGVGGYPGAPGLTRYPFLPGTPAYRAPEAWRYQHEHAARPGVRYEAGPADDLWALGVSLYWLLTDRDPFEAADDAAEVEAVLHRTPPAPQAVDGRVPEALGRVCLRMLEKSPEARYPDARALEAALLEALAGADAAWDVPLCDFHDVHTATTKGEVKDLRAWAHAPQRPPRRGPRPAAEAPEGGEGAVALPEEAPPQASGKAAEAAPAEGPVLAAPGVPVARVPAPVPGQEARAAERGELRQRRRTAWGGLGVVVGLGLLVAAGGVVWWGAPARVQGLPSRHAGEAGPIVQEVAPPGRPPEAHRATAPPTLAALPVAVASVAAPPEDSAPMKKPQPPTAPLKKQLLQAGSVAGACLTLACTGPQVRPAPPPEDCPEEVVTTMEELGIDIGFKVSAQFTGYTGDPRVITVRGGGAQVRLDGGYSDQFRGSTVLSCQLTLSERVYGRCNWARNTYGKSFPVCFQLHDSEGPVGLLRETEGGPDSVGVFNAFSVKPVRRFE